MTKYTKDSLSSPVHASTVRHSRFVLQNLFISQKLLQNKIVTIASTIKQKAINSVTVLVCGATVAHILFLRFSHCRHSARDAKRRARRSSALLVSAPVSSQWNNTGHVSGKY